MKWNINDAERRLELIDEHGDIKVIAKFINKEELQDRAYTLYAYAYVKSNQLFIKFGEAKKQSIYDRYHRGTATNANNQMIAIWASEKGDKEIHKVLKTAGHALSGFISASYDELNTEEAYHILSEQGYTNILNLITKDIIRHIINTNIKLFCERDINIHNADIIIIDILNILK